MADTHRTAAYATLTDAVEGLTRRGFTESFRIADGGLRTVATREALRAEDLTIREYHRFEGISDLDDMAIIYALESKGGVRGTLVDAFGVYSDPAVSAVLSAVPIRALP